MPTPRPHAIPIDLSDYPLFLVMELAAMVRDAGSWPKGLETWLDSYDVDPSEIPPACGPDDCLADPRGLVLGLPTQRLCHYCRERYVALWTHRLQERLRRERDELVVWTRDLAA